MAAALTAVLLVLTTGAGASWLIGTLAHLAMALALLLVSLLVLTGLLLVLGGVIGGVIVGMFTRVVSGVALALGTGLLRLLSAVVGLTFSAAVHAVGAPRESVVFDVLDERGSAYQVRLLHPGEGLLYGSEVRVSGWLIAGVLHAGRVELTATRVRLRPRTLSASLITSTLLIAALVLASNALII
ncbi:hypothetical protein [Kineococcus gypseus]|uniref:hypothetical protein n=1 Tax=Kineococcus gypseus TaxID=1637102 RepID=UPI003D7E5085